MDRTQSFLDEVMRLEQEITELGPTDPRLARVGERVDALEGEVRAARGAMRPLVPDGDAPASTEEAAMVNLERALDALRGALAAKAERRR